MARRASDRAFFYGSCVLLGLLVAVITTLAGIFSLKVWSVGDTRCFYDMAAVILRGGVPYVDYLDPKPPLIYFLLTLPLAVGYQLAGGLALVGLANFVSAVIVLGLGWKLYGRNAGLLAAVLFAINFSLAEGYFIITEPFTVTFTLLSAYCLVCGAPRHKYLLAGIAAGLAIGFKQYALLLLPLSIFLMWRKKEYSGFLPYVAGVFLPLAVMFGAIFLVYGFQAGDAALHWSFGVAGSYMTEGSVEGVPAYKIDDPLIALSWLVLGFSLFSPLILLAGAALLDRRLSLHEEFFLLAALAFGATLIIRPFLHYWALALPFIALLAVSGMAGDRPARAVKALSSLTDRAFTLAAAGLYALILLVSVAVSTLLMDALWRPLDILRFYGLADIVLKATNPYMAHVPEPSLLRLDLFSPGQTALWGLLAAAVILLCAALVIMRLGTALYGRRAGLLSGVLFTVSISWSLGFVSVSDALAMLFLALSLYVTASGRSRRYLLCGLCLGTAVALKPLAVLALPALAWLAYREGSRDKALGLVAGALAVPLFAWLALAAAIPGTVASGLAGISVGMVPLTTHGGGYTVTDPLIAMLNIVSAATVVTILIPVAALALAGRPASRFEECLVIAGLLLLGTLLLRQYVHYWFLALPFLALACACVLLHKPCELHQKA